MSLIVATENDDPRFPGADILVFYWDDGTYLHDLGGWPFPPHRPLLPGTSDAYIDRVIHSAVNAERWGRKNLEK